MTSSTFYLITLLLMIPVLIGGATYKLAGNKGYNAPLFGILAGALALLFLLPGLALFIVVACIPPKHIYCPHCGERNIHFLKTCRRCSTKLPSA
jgi:hypothetical protein